MSDTGAFAQDHEFRRFLDRQAEWTDYLDSLNWRKRKKVLRKQAKLILPRIKEVEKLFVAWEGRNR